MMGPTSIIPIPSALGLQMSNLDPYSRGMKLKHLFPELHQNGQLIAAFGRAQLVKTVAGQYELRGGSSEEQAQAKEWISLFMHEILLAGRAPECRS
jgi:hypothetical protein